MPDSINKNQIILITGGTGYLGSRLTLLLSKKGYQVRVADKARPEERGINFPNSVDFRQGDLRESSFVRNILKNVKTIVHLAANVGSLTYMHNHQAEILQENCAIDANVYPAAVKAGVKRIIYSSSSMVFQHSLKFPYHESDLPAIPPPTNVYGLSKLVGEYFCRAYYQQFGLPYVILRYHNIYGPGESSKGKSSGDIHVIPALIEKILSGQYPLEILGNPEATRSFTYVDDAVRATFMVLERALRNDKKVLNNDFNIGPKEALKIVDLAKMIWEIMGNKRKFKYLVKETEAITAEHRQMNPEKIEKIIGWKPKVSLREGLIKTIDWMKNRQNRPFSLLN